MKVVLLMGGRSAEREISIQSGEAVVRALRARGHRVTPVPVGRDLAARLARLKPDVAFNALHEKEYTAALSYTERGHEASVAASDEEGVVTYYENLQSLRVIQALDADPERGKRFRRPECDGLYQSRDGSPDRCHRDRARCQRPQGTVGRGPAALRHRAAVLAALDPAKTLEGRVGAAAIARMGVTALRVRLPGLEQDAVDRFA